jgi:hypothetical protein
LVKAKDMIHKPGISIEPVEEVEYLHILLDAHEVILAENAWTESFQPAEVLVDDALDENLALFPEMVENCRKGAYDSARNSAKWFEAQLVV